VKLISFIVDSSLDQRQMIRAVTSAAAGRDPLLRRSKLP
jgi:hypothetical protein